MIAILPRDEKCHINKIMEILGADNVNYDAHSEVFNEPSHDRKNRLIIYGHPTAGKDCILNSERLYEIISGYRREYIGYIYAHVCFGFIVLSVSKFGKLIPQYVSFKESQILWLNQNDFEKFHLDFLSNLHQLIYETEITEIKAKISSLIDNTVKELRLRSSEVGLVKELQIQHLLFPFIKQFKIETHA